MLFTRPLCVSDDSIRDKSLIKELIEFERYCRDHKLWDEMRKCYLEDSMINVSWFSGSGWDFVSASEKMETDAPHKINNILVWLRDDKAVAECMACVQMRKAIRGVSYDLTSYVRLHYKLIKKDAEWYVISMEGIYEKDTLVPAYPTDLPIDISEEIAGHRPSYANLCYLLRADGYSVDEDLPGDDLPETVAALYENSRRWLEN